MLHNLETLNNLVHNFDTIHNLETVHNLTFLPLVICDVKYKAIWNDFGRCRNFVKNEWVSKNGVKLEQGVLRTCKLERTKLMDYYVLLWKLHSTILNMFQNIQQEIFTNKFNYINILKLRKRASFANSFGLWEHFIHF